MPVTSAAMGRGSTRARLAPLLMGLLLGWAIGATTWAAQALPPGWTDRHFDPFNVPLPADWQELRRSADEVTWGRLDASRQGPVMSLMWSRVPFEQEPSTGSGTLVDTGPTTLGGWSARGMEWSTRQGSRPIRLLVRCTTGPLPHGRYACALAGVGGVDLAPYRTTLGQILDGVRRAPGPVAANSPGVGDSGGGGPARTSRGAVLLDDVRPGSLAEWRERYDPRAMNPEFWVEEISSPLDGSTALRTRARGTTLASCETKWIRRAYGTGPQTTDGTALEAYLAFSFDRTVYSLPSVKVELLDANGRTLGGRVYFGKGVIGEFNRGQLAKTGYVELSAPSGTFRFDLGREFGAGQHFSGVAVSLMNYACEGQNAVVFDRMILYPGGSTQPVGPAALPTAPSPQQPPAPTMDLSPTIQMTQWIGNDTWTWTLTRRAGSNIYDAVALNNQTRAQSRHIFEVRSFDGKNVVFFRPDAGLYTGVLAADGRSLTGKTNFAGSGNEGWRATLRP